MYNIYTYMEVENKENDENLDIQNMPTMQNTGSLSEQSLEVETPAEERSIEGEESGEPVVEEGEPEVEEAVEEAVAEGEPVVEGEPEEATEEATEEPVVEEEATEEPVVEEAATEEAVEEKPVHEPRQLERVEGILKDAGNFRKKLKTLKKRLPLLDDDEKEHIRNGVIREFINVLKISKPAHTIKRFGRRLNNLRNAFNDSLNVLNGTAKKRPRKKSRKQRIEEEPIPMESSTFSESQL